MASDKYDAQYMTADEFLAAHPELGPSTDRDTLTALLGRAIANGDVPSRAALANRLLDWGASATFVDNERSNVLHGFAQRLKDPAVEAPLFKRLLEAGADPNLQSPRYGLPLEILMYLPRFNEEQLAPVYDVLFQRPDLDFTIEDRTGDSLWDKIGRGTMSWPGLVARTQAYILQHTGSPPPPARMWKKQPNGSWLPFVAGDTVEQDADGVWHITQKGPDEGPWRGC
jgi:hypothetical protein